jgi:glucose/arabinose dehydrogenase
MAFLPDHSLLITEKAGRLRLLRDGELTEITGVPAVSVVGQGGLLDVAVHPQYAENGWIYLSHSSAYSGGVGTALTRARIGANGGLVDLQPLYRMPSPGTGGQHFGSRIAFDAAGYVYLTIGDRGQQARAQDLSRAEGKLLRLHDDGRIPADNPFVGIDGALGEIYSFGHRNAQGLHYDPQTGRLWLHEHGPQGGDALHVIQAGANYGWPIASYGSTYGAGQPIGALPHELEAVTNPYTYWVPTSIAPSGLTVYRGHAFPGWKGDLFLGALAQRHIHRVVPGTTAPLRKQELLRNAYGRIRDVASGPDELIYFLTDGAAGALYRLEPEVTSPWFSILPQHGWRDTANTAHNLGHVYDAYWPWLYLSHVDRNAYDWIWLPDLPPDNTGYYAWRHASAQGNWIWVHPPTGALYDVTASQWVLPSPAP